MAQSTISESSYFPPLDKCLAGDAQIIGWRTAYQALRDQPDNVNLQRFFNDDETLKELAASLDPPTKPSAKSASDFETKTAPIHVAQASESQFSVEELKEDAKWLSKELQIEEPRALRLTVLERQNRAAVSLLASADGFAPTNTSLTTNLTPNEAANGAVDGVSSEANNSSLESRRTALLEVYLSENVHLLKVVSYLAGRAAVSKGQGLGYKAGAVSLSRPQPAWIDRLASKVLHDWASSRDSEGKAGLCKRCIKKIEDTTTAAEDSSTWPDAVVKLGLQESYIKARFLEITHLLRVLLASLYSLQGIPPADLVTSWFTLMRKVEFLQQSRPIFIAVGLDASVSQLLVSIISVEILRAELVVDDILGAAGLDSRPADVRSYIGDANCVRAINEAFRDGAFMALSIASPAILAWSTIAAVIQEISRIHHDSSAEATSSASRRASVPWISDYEKASDFLSRGFGETIDDPSRWLAATAVDGLGVMGVISTLGTTVSSLLGADVDAPIAYMTREVLFDILKHSIAIVQYGSEIIEAFLSILAPNEQSDASQIHSAVLAGKTLDDHEQLRPAILDQALARYPHELSPLVRLLAVLASARDASGAPSGVPMLHWLDNLQSITVMVSESFNSYQLEHENMNSNEVTLTEALPLFVARQEFLSWRTGRAGRLLLAAGRSNDAHTTTSIPAGTSGTVVKEPRPFIFKLNHHHSGLEYLGLLLHTFMPNSSQVPVAPSAVLDRPTAAEVVSLFVSLLDAALKEPEGVAEAQHLLGRLSNALGDQLDIVSVIAEIFEAELMCYLDQNPQEGSLDLVIACVQFLCQLVAVSPERIWSVLARSTLLGVTDGAASLASVVGGDDLQSGRFSFLATCARLHSKLLEDAITGCAKRRSQMVQQKSNRFETTPSQQDSTPERTMSTVLSCYQKILLDTIQSMPDWKFSAFSEKSGIVVPVIQSFTQLLLCVYGHGGFTSGTKSLSAVLSSAAESLLDSCAPETGPTPLPDSIGRLLLDGLLSTEEAMPAQAQVAVVEQTTSILQFLTVLVRSARTPSTSANSGPNGGTSTQVDHAGKGASAGKRAVSMATDLLRCMPMLVGLLAAANTFKTDTYALLTELVSVVGSSDSEPPAVLGFLKPQTATMFLTVMTRLDRPLSDVQTERRIWDFFSAAINSKQQWISIFLLSGRLPRNRNKSGKHEQLKGKTVLAYTLDQLSNIADLSPERALGMLKFLALAQQTLVWSTQQLRGHPEFLRKTVSWLDNLKDAFKETPTSSDALTRRAKEYEMAAYLCDVLAINVHASLETGDKSVLRGLIPRLTFLRDFGVSVDAYNRSLHRNLADNFARRFPQCSLADFQRTHVSAANYGPEYFYDREFAARILQHDPSWSGPGRGGKSGFSEEFLRANVNMSMLHAQMQLLRSWKTLTTTLCECADQDPTLYTAAAKVAEKCLLANASTQLDEPCMAEALEMRLELAFVITSRLVALKVDGPYMKDLLPAAWELIVSSPVDYEVAAAVEDVQYYRRLLQVLYLSIQPQIYLVPAKASAQSSEAAMAFLPASVSSCLVSIVGKIIAPGFRALCGNLHNDIQLALPGDFALLTALLQAIVSVPGINTVQTMLSDIVAGSSIIRGALSLYSWSDQLAEVMDADPVYGQVSINFLLALSTVRPIAEQMALDGVLIQLSSANLSNYFRKANGKGPFDDPARMFSIWTEGYLPLCLNLLDAVGPPIAAEVAVFLNTFPEQLKRVSRSFDNEQRGPKNPHGGAITLSMVSEAHSLAMIALIVGSDIARGAAEGINAADIPELACDLPEVKTKVEALWRNKRALRDRITPTNALEARWQKTTAPGGSESVLEVKILKEISSMLACFGESAE